MVAFGLLGVVKVEEEGSGQPEDEAEDEGVDLAQETKTANFVTIYLTLNIHRDNREEPHSVCQGESIAFDWISGRWSCLHL